MCFAFRFAKQHVYTSQAVICERGHKSSHGIREQHRFAQEINDGTMWATLKSLNHDGHLLGRGS